MVMMTMMMLYRVEDEMKKNGVEGQRRARLVQVSTFEVWIWELCLGLGFGFGIRLSSRAKMLHKMHIARRTSHATKYMPPASLRPRWCGSSKCLRTCGWFGFFVGEWRLVASGECLVLCDS